MRRLLAILSAAAMVTTLVPVTAGAVPPTRQTIELTNTIVGFAADCGINMQWDISLTVERTRFFDQDGNLVRIQDQVRENNTITNLDTGETLQEGPDSFQQRILFNADGSVTVMAIGLSVLVNDGDAIVIDAGRLVLLFGPGAPEVVALNGRHDLREIDPLTTSDPILLNGFCAAFTG